MGTLVSEIMSTARPQFLIGFFIGVCLSSAALQAVLLTLGMKGLGDQLPLLSSSVGAAPHSPEHLRLKKREASLYANYEIHNVGLKLHSADGGAAGGETQHAIGVGDDQHVIKYLTEEDSRHRVAGVHHDSFISEPSRSDGGAWGTAPNGGADDKKLVYTAVLTGRERLTDQASVVRMTWGSELPAVQFFYDLGNEAKPSDSRTKRDHVREIVGLQDVNAGEVFTSIHTLQALRHVCSRHLDDYVWYVIVRDATYVHTSGLLRTLDRLSTSEDVILGEQDSALGGACAATPGIILSSRALSRVCTRVDICHGKDNVEQCLGMQCVSSDKISPELHVIARGHGHVDVAQLVGESDIVNNDQQEHHQLQLSEQSVFVGTLPYARDFYRLHLHFTRVKIAETQGEIARLGAELSRTRRSVRPKRDQSLLRVQETAIFGQDALLNKTSEPFYQFIDSSGNLYLDTCKVRKQDITRDTTGSRGASPYTAALNLAKNAVGMNLNTDAVDFFSYKVTRPNVGIEYQFFFIQTLTHNPIIGHRRKPPKEKVYQVTVLHPYDKLEMESKEIKVAKKINFVVPTNDGHIETIQKFLLNYEQVCLKKGPDRCSLLIVVYKDDQRPQGSTGANTRSKIRKALLLLEEKYLGMASQVMEVQGESQTLARTVQMADSAFDRDALVTFLQPEVDFNEDFLFRCQFNSQPMRRAYFPVIFQRFGHSTSSSDEYTQTTKGAAYTGYWANSDFTNFCAYNEDIQVFDNLPSSSRDLHNMFKASEYMGVFRAPDPGLARNWSNHACSMSNSVDRSNCFRELKYMNMQ